MHAEVSASANSASESANTNNTDTNASAETHSSIGTDYDVLEDVAIVDLQDNHEYAMEGPDDSDGSTHHSNSFGSGESGCETAPTEQDDDDVLSEVSSLHSGDFTHEDDGTTSESSVTEDDLAGWDVATEQDIADVDLENTNSSSDSKSSVFASEYGFDDERDGDDEGINLLQDEDGGVAYSQDHPLPSETASRWISVLRNVPQRAEDWEQTEELEDEEDEESVDEDEESVDEDVDEAYDADDSDSCSQFERDEGYLYIGEYFGMPLYIRC